MNKLIPSLIVIVVAATAGWFFLFNIEREILVEIGVTPGAHEVKISVLGRVDTLKSTSLRAPDCKFSRQVVWLKEEGAFVKKGELVAKFDASDVAMAIEDLGLRTQNLLEDEINMGLAWDMAVERMENTVTMQIEAVALQEIELGQKKYHATLVRKMFEVMLNNQNGILKSLGSQKENLLQQRKMAEQNFKERFERHKRNVALVESYLELYNIYAPFDSVIHYPEIMVSGIYKKAEAGDSLVQAQEFARLPDFSVKSLVLQIKEHEIKYVHNGMRVNFSTKTYPNIILKGVVKSVSNVPSEEIFDSTRQFFDVLVELDQTQENMNLILPGMSIRADIIVEELKDVYAIPADYLAKDGQKLFITILNSDSKKQDVYLDKVRQDGNYAIIASEAFSAKPLKIISNVR